MQNACEVMSENIPDYLKDFIDKDSAFENNCKFHFILITEAEIE